jgi:hypothetical protein
MNQTIIEVSLDSDDGQRKVLDIYETKGSGGPDGKDGSSF